jgi:cytochrome c peroxidase
LNAETETAIRVGEKKFGTIGCARCHVPSLPLSARGRIYTEPGPHNPPGNLRTGEAPEFSIDLSDETLPQPRLRPDSAGVVHVPAFTDLKLHDICSGPDDPNVEPLDMQHSPGSQQFFAGNSKFLTKKLWGAANEPPYFHHGKFTTLREAVLAHAGEALESRKAFEGLSADEQNALIEFLKSLRVLPPGTRSLVVDEYGRPRNFN